MKIKNRRPSTNNTSCTGEVDNTDQLSVDSNQSDGRKKYGGDVSPPPSGCHLKSKSRYKTNKLTTACPSSPNGSSNGMVRSTNPKVRNFKNFYSSTLPSPTNQTLDPYEFAVSKMEDEQRSDQCSLSDPTIPIKRLKLDRPEDRSSHSDSAQSSPLLPAGRLDSTQPNCLNSNFSFTENSVNIDASSSCTQPLTVYTDFSNSTITTTTVADKELAVSSNAPDLAVAHHDGDDDGDDDVDDEKKSDHNSPIDCCTVVPSAIKNPDRVELKRCVGVNTVPDCSKATLTEQDLLGPCEPGTAICLNGIVWLETTTGVLVVNATWRGRTYIGTLLDATQHDFAPPRPRDYIPPFKPSIRSSSRTKRRSNLATSNYKSGTVQTDSNWKTSSTLKNHRLRGRTPATPMGIEQSSSRSAKRLEDDADAAGDQLVPTGIKCNAVRATSKLHRKLHRGASGSTSSSECASDIPAITSGRLKESDDEDDIVVEDDDDLRNLDDDGELPNNDGESTTDELNNQFPIVCPLNGCQKRFSHMLALRFHLNHTPHNQITKKGESQKAQVDEKEQQQLQQQQQQHQSNLDAPPNIVSTCSVYPSSTQDTICSQVSVALSHQPSSIASYQTTSNPLQQLPPTDVKHPLGLKTLQELQITSNGTLDYSNRSKRSCHGLEPQSTRMVTAQTVSIPHGTVDNHLASPNMRNTHCTTPKRPFGVSTASKFRFQQPQPHYPIAKAGSSQPADSKESGDPNSWSSMMMTMMMMNSLLKSPTQHPDVSRNGPPKPPTSFSPPPNPSSCKTHLPETNSNNHCDIPPFPPSLESHANNYAIPEFLTAAVQNLMTSNGLQLQSLPEPMRSYMLQAAAASSMMMMMNTNSSPNMADSLMNQNPRLANPIATSQIAKSHLTNPMLDQWTANQILQNVTGPNTHNLAGHVNSNSQLDSLKLSAAYLNQCMNPIRPPQMPMPFGNQPF